jgi:TolB-like protein/DNA-binding winged helix-turn-helix (wHTH) protein
MSPTHADFRLGHWIVRPQRCRIERGDEVIRIKPKSMAVLERLARNSDAVTTRDEIFESVWPGAAVTDDVLTHSIVELRKAFGDTARDARVIETIPKKGFRLLLPVGEIENAPAATRSFTARPVIAAIFAVTVLGTLLTWQRFNEEDPPPDPVDDAVTSVAVLPFVDMSSAGDQEYFADGLSEELINRLTQLRGLQVTGRTSSFYFKGRNEDLRAIGDKLGVNNVLEGSVRKSDARLRITAQLIDVSSGFHLWSEVFDRPTDDIFKVQEEISEAVALALSITLSVGNLGMLEGSTTSLDAFEEIALGNAMHRDMSADGLQKAIDHYERATEIDPQFALAWANIAAAYRHTRLVLTQSEFQERLQASDHALNQALRLAPNSPNILRIAAQKDIDDGQWAAAGEKLQRAEDNDKSVFAKASGTQIDFLAKVGQIREAIARTERAQRADPLDAGLSMYLGHLYATNGEVERGLAELERGYGFGDTPGLISVEGLVNALAGGDAATIRLWLERAIEHQQPGALNVHEEMARLFGDSAAALSWLQDGFQDGNVPDYYTAVWASYYGDHQLAAQALLRSLDTWLFWLPVMRDARQLPEFRTALTEVGLEAYWRQHGWPDTCRPAGPTDFVCDQ